MPKASQTKQHKDLRVIHLNIVKFYADLCENTPGLPAWENLTASQKESISQEIKEIWAAYETATMRLEIELVQ